MNVLKLTLLFSVSLNVAVLGMTAYHRFSRGHDPESHRGGRGEMSEELELSPAQEQEFNGLRSTFHDRRREYNTRMTELRKALLAELVAEAPVRERIDELLPALSEQQAAIERRLVDHLLSEKALLRPEQREAFRRVLERHILSPENESSEGRRSEHDPGAP